MNRARRGFLARTAAASAALLAGGRASVHAQHQHRVERASIDARMAARREANGTAVSVIAPDVPNLPFEQDGDVKVFHLVAEPVARQIAPGRMLKAWGFNGSVPGPMIQVNQGDRVRVVFDNHLPESTSIHWHGFEIPVEMDGMPYLSQRPIPPGERFVYEFTLHQEGTYFYHSHGAMQEMMGMIGLFVLHPKQPYEPRVDHDFAIVLQEWALLPNNDVPNTANMEFNWLTFNGKAAPDTTPLVVRVGSRVRIRIVNLGMDHHPIHLHGHTFYVTGTEAGRQPAVLWGPQNTVLVGVAQARDFEFVANNPGDWMLHCHLPHHMMNSMSDLIADRMMTPMRLDDSHALAQMQTFADDVGFEHLHHAPVAPNANDVPGFPQDAFMEMGMDQAVYRPENDGLALNWSAMSMGMMTLVRVVSDARYTEIMDLKRDGSRRGLTPLPHSQHKPHGG